MMLLDLFPVGLYQFSIVLDDGLWLARAQQVVAGDVFQTLTYFRSVGGLVFVVGVLSLIWFILSRGLKLKPETGSQSQLDDSEFGVESASNKLG